MSFSRLHGLIFILCLGSFMLFGCEAPKTETPALPTPKVDGNSVTLVSGSHQIDSISVEAATPDENAVTPITGRVTWDDDATVRVYTPVSGRVQKILGEVGERVDAGTPLVLVDSPDFGQSQSDAAKADS